MSQQHTCTFLSVSRHDPLTLPMVAKVEAGQSLYTHTHTHKLSLTNYPPTLDGKLVAMGLQKVVSR